MAKKKLIKRGTNQKRVSKSFKVQDVDGNEHVLRATVIGVDTKKIRKEQSHRIIDEEVRQLSMGSKIIKPPLSQRELSVLSEFSSELGPNIDQFVIGVEGFGQKLGTRKMSPAQKEKYKEKIEVEWEWMKNNVIDNPNPDGSLRTLRKSLLKDRENTGNSYVELVPNRSGTKYTCYNRIEPGSIWITRADKNFTRIEVKYINKNLQLKTKTFLERLRMFVQIVGKKKVFYKSFRDPRMVDARNGEILRLRSNDKGEQVPVNKNGEEVKKRFLARELFHFKIGSSRRTPYGMPKYVGNIIGIKGSRSAEEANILTLQNNNVPSMVIMVSGGMLTDGSIARIQEFVDTAIKGDLNHSKFLILEGEGQHDSLSGQSSMKIDIQPLTNNQHTDALWSEYDKNNNDKTRRSFRQPQSLVGKTEKIGKDEAFYSEVYAEKYVYNPEREELDDDWNAILTQQGFRFHIIKTNSPNVTNEEILTKILASSEKTGGMTPRIARALMEKTFNDIEFPPIKEDDPDFDPDLPFSISIGKLARGLGAANQEGTMAPSGQTEGAKGKDNRDKTTIMFEKVRDSLDPQKQIEAEFLEAFEEILDVDTFGKSKKDYFNHDH